MKLSVPFYGGKRNKKMEMEEIVKLLIFVTVLVIVAGAVIILLQGKGSDILDSIRNLLRFGR